MRTISIANQKGGCGKTTTSINLASTLALNGRKVLLLDLDPQSHASLGLNIDSTTSIYNAISRLTPQKMQARDLIVNAEDNFDILPSNVLVGTLEQELADEIGRELKLKEALKPIEHLYDYILIDFRPSLGFLTINALRASGEVIVPVETSRFSLQGVDRLMDIVNLINDRLNHSVSCRILVTMFDSRLRHSFEMLAKIKEKFAGKISDTIIHTNVKLKESVVLGKSVSRYDKYSRGFKDYYSFAKELITYEKDKRPLSAPPSSRIMRQIIKENAPAIAQTTFSLTVPEAQSVYVTGTFNDWSLDETYRMRKENGQWILELPLKQGQHRYRFIIDGKWQEDPQNPIQEINPFGDINSVIEVR